MTAVAVGAAASAAAGTLPVRELPAELVALVGTWSPSSWTVRPAAGRYTSSAGREYWVEPTAEAVRVAHVTGRRADEHFATVVVVTAGDGRELLAGWAPGRMLTVPCRAS